MPAVSGIKVTPELLRQDAKTVDNLKTQHADLIKKLDNIVKGLDNVWIGESQTAFVQEYDAMKPTFNKFIDILGRYSSEMISSANILEEADKEAAAKTRNSFSGL